MDSLKIAESARRPPVRAIFATLMCGVTTLAAGAATPDPSVRSLQRQLEQRDAVIQDLQRRVQELERRTGAAEPAEPGAGATTAGATAPGEAPQAAAPTETSVPGEEEKAAEQPPPTEGAPAPAPGQVTVTEEEAERALERTLVAAGVLLLPFGQLELEPAFTYTRREFDSPELEPGTTRAPKIRRNEFQPSISARVGLPFDSQVELDLPYNVVQQERILDFPTLTGTTQTESKTNTGQSIGDLSVGIAKTVFQEKGWRPDLIARFTWEAPTGETQDRDVLLDSGINAISGQLTALKRQDPLAFFASTFYQKAFEHNNIQPGNEVGFSLGAFLATSPETSLGISLDQTFSDDNKVNGRVVDGSDQVSAVLNVGVSSLLAPGVLLQLNAGVGLTEDAPDYTFSISLPIRFDLPTL